MDPTIHSMKSLTVVLHMVLSLQNYVVEHTCILVMLFSKEKMS